MAKAKRVGLESEDESEDLPKVKLELSEGGIPPKVSRKRPRRESSLGT